MAKENKSLKEIAQELGTSKQTVYRIVLSLGVSEAEQDGQKRLYDADAQKRIKQAYKERQEQIDRIKRYTSEARPKYRDAELEALRERLADKEKEIERLTRETERLYQLADQAQRLQMQTEQRYQALLEVKEQEQETKQDEPQEPEPEKVSWWKKLFS